MPSSIHTKKNNLKPHRVLKSGRRPGQTSRNGRGLKYNSSKRDTSISHVVEKSGLALLTLENSEALVNARRKEKKKPKREAYRAAKKAARRERGAAKAGMAVEESGMGTVEEAGRRRFFWASVQERMIWGPTRTGVASIGDHVWDRGKHA